MTMKEQRKRSAMSALAIPAGLAAVVALLAATGAERPGKKSAGEEAATGKGKKEAPAVVSVAARPPVTATPSTAVVPADQASFFVLLRSEGPVGKKVATKWDGSVTVSQGRVEEARLWKSAMFNRASGNTWKLTTQRRLPPYRIP